jgi:aminoglycoside phosphotransferase (APT) family kinase protein
VSDIAERLRRFLTSQSAAAGVDITDCSPVTGGNNHTTTRFTAHIDGAEFSLVSRSEFPTGRILTASNRDLEWAVLRHLTETGASFIAAARWYDHDGSIMGTKTVISDFVPAKNLVSTWPVADSAERGRLTDRVVDLAVSIAQVDTEPLPALMTRPTSWDTYIDDMIDEWRRTEARMDEPEPFLRYVAAWLELNRPAPAPFVLVHGDFQAPNMLVTDDHLIAVDWELPHIGDIREDLAWLQMLDGMSAEPIYRGNEDYILSRFRELTGLGEDVINQRSIAYFSILSITRTASMVYEQITAMVRGDNTSINVAYSSFVLATHHAQWYKLIGELSTARETSNPCHLNHPLAPQWVAYF